MMRRRAARGAAPASASVPEIAIHRQYMQPPETIEVESRVVACDGGNAALGHPRVYLNMGDEKFVECPYCDRRFALKPGAGGHDAH